jgi:hypothetical protein
MRTRVIERRSVLTAPAEVFPFRARPRRGPSHDPRLAAVDPILEEWRRRLPRNRPITMADVDQAEREMRFADQDRGRT